MQVNKKQMGAVIEQHACDLLKSNGMSLITKNYHSPYGEIDLIMQDKEFIVFIEVRSRKNSEYGSAIESIQFAKQQKILKAATHYLHTHHLIDVVDCRFDVIGFSNNSFEWIKDAFSYE